MTVRGRGGCFRSLHRKNNGSCDLPKKEFAMILVYRNIYLSTFPCLIEEVGTGNPFMSRGFYVCGGAIE